MTDTRQTVNADGMHWMFGLAALLFVLWISDFLTGSDRLVIETDQGRTAIYFEETGQAEPTSATIDTTTENTK